MTGGTGSMTGPVLPATCRTYDPDAGGLVVLDDGRSVPYRPDALAGTPLRLLRPGQRLVVRLDRPADEAGARVVALTLPSLPLR
jgi:hypothetical protein